MSNTKEINLKPTPKQYEAWQALQDDAIKFLVFGGGAGGGKSWLGCEWLLTMCYQYPGSKWFIGREELTRLKKSTYITWTKVCKYHEIPREDWKLNSQDNYIEFINPDSAAFGSRIDLLDVSFKPSDPLYERFGSTEYTGGFLEEAGEINFKAFDVLKSRIGRHLNREYSIKPKIYITCNPKKNWLYSKIYKPWKAGKLPPQYAFIQALYYDNPHTAKDYGETLAEIEDPVMRQRLEFGNWEYDDDPAKMMDYDAICDMFFLQIEHNKPTRYMTIDVAREGVDKAVIMVWYDFDVREIHVWEKCTLDNLQEDARDIANKHGIPRSQIIADEDGVGGGFVDNFKCKGFKNNASPIQKKIETSSEKQLKQLNYENIKAQCAHIMARKINNHEVAMCATTHEEDIKEELEILKRVDLDKEGKFKIIKKDDVKDLIGRSPDFLDTVIMRGYFELKPKKGKKIGSKLKEKVTVNMITGRPQGRINITGLRR